MISIVAIFLSLALICTVLFCRRVIKALNKRIHLLTSVYQSLDIGIIARDQSGEYTFANRSAEKRLGKKISHLPAAHWADYFGLFDLKTGYPITADENPLDRALSGIKTGPLAMQVRRRAQDEPIDVKLRAVPVYSADGQVVGGVMTWE